MNLGAPANDMGGEPLGAGRQADIGVGTGDEPGAMPPKAANQNEQIDAGKLPETGPANDNLTPGAVRAADEVPATPGSAASPSGISADEAAQAMARGEVTDEALGAILKSTDAELSAIKRYASREAAAEAVQAYRDAARRALIVENLDVIAPLVRKRQQEAMGVYQKNRERRQQQQSGGQQILDALRPK